MSSVQTGTQDGIEPGPRGRGKESVPAAAPSPPPTAQYGIAYYIFILELFFFSC